MAATISLPEVSILTALRAFLLAVLPLTVEVVRGQDNRVPEPEGDDFVIMTPTLRQRLATTVDTFTDPYPAAGGTRSSLQPTQVTVQLDVHGPNSAENAQIISTLMRSPFGCGQFHQSGFDVQALYASDPRQTPFVNAENQYETRWTVDAVMQANIIVGTPEQFAGELRVAFADIPYHDF